LAHPHLMSLAHCLDAAVPPSPDTANVPSVSRLVHWGLSEMSALAEEMFPDNKSEAISAQLRAHESILKLVTVCDWTTEEYGSDDANRRKSLLASCDATPHSPGAGLTNSRGFFQSAEDDAASAAETTIRAAAWYLTAASFLEKSGPLLSQPGYTLDAERPLVPMMKHALLGVRAPILISACPTGAAWARQALEVLVAKLTGAEKEAPAAVLCDAFPLVAKFFLQHLQVLYQNEGFGQTWLSVLRLMLLFQRSGRESKNPELEVIATETLKNLLCMLFDAKLLGFVKSEQIAGNFKTLEEAQHALVSPVGGPPSWWNMTWYSIEVFVPGFVDEFKTLFPDNVEAVTVEAGCAE